MQTPLRRHATTISFGGDTFRNPFFWILVGVAGTLAAQYVLTKRNKE
jgi:hypothetical protein